MKSIAAVLITVGIVGCDSGEPSNHWREEFDPEFGVGVLRSIVPFDSLDFPEQADSNCRRERTVASTYPLSPGNRWTYVYAIDRGDSLEYDWDSLLNKDVYPKAGELDTGISVFPVATYYPIQEHLLWFELFGRDDTGLHAFGGLPENDSLFESSIRYPYPAALGDTYEVVVRRYDPDRPSQQAGSWHSVRGDGEIVALDTLIRTPAGDFLSTIYRTYTEPSGGHPGSYSFAYVSEGVGVVATASSYFKELEHQVPSWWLADYCLVPES